MIFILTFTAIASITACGQTLTNAKDDEKAIKNIKSVFEDYIKHQESTDSQENKDLMAKSIESLTKITHQEAFEILIDVWLYYDPTDFPTRDLINKVLKNNRAESLKAVELRMNNRNEWETDETAPYSELKDLLNMLVNEKKGTLELMQGLWFHTQDSLATVYVNNQQWNFGYLQQKNDSNRFYSITITDKLPEFVSETENAEFLILTSKSDIMHYEILGLTDSTFSLMYFPSGKKHLYKRRK